jgi:trk system potassium uptake protein TrkA
MKKYIIMGLGSFGASLAEKLTQEGNEVIGVDASMAKVDAMKDRISHVIRLDATDAYTVSGLPIADTDVVIVAIGEDQGANIMATAIMKNLKAKRLISRAISKLHEGVLQAIGVDEIVHPEEETAERWAKKLCLKGLVDSFELAGEFSIVEVAAPAKYHGMSLGDIGFRRNYNVVVLTTIRKGEQRNMLGVTRTVQQAQEVASSKTVLQEGELMVLYGLNKDIKKLLDEF